MGEPQRAMTILPYCIFHTIRPESDTYTSFVGVTSITSDGKYVCTANSVNFSHLYNIFYAVSPMLRPVPLGMQVYCAVQSKSAPYITTDVTLIYDIFSRSRKTREHGGCTMFMAYAQPVPNTVPLYLHMRYGQLFPTFDKNPPTTDSNWGLATCGSPIHVITPESVNMSADNMDNTQFKCVSGRCLPWVDGKFDDVYGTTNIPARNLVDCIVYCEELALGGPQPSSVLAEIQRDEAVTTNDTRSRFETKTYRRPIFYSMIRVIVVLIVVAVFLMFIRKAKKSTEGRK